MIRFFFMVLFLSAFQVKALVLYGIGDGNRLFWVSTKTQKCSVSNHFKCEGRLHHLLTSPKHLFVSYRFNQKYYVGVFDKKNAVRLETIEINGNLGAMTYDKKCRHLMIAECTHRGNRVRIFDEAMNEKDSIPLHVSQRFQKGAWISENIRLFPFYMCLGEDDHLRIVDYKNRFGIVGHNDVYFGSIENPKHLILSGKCTNAFVAYHIDSKKPPQRPLKFFEAMEKRARFSWFAPSQISVFPVSAASKAVVYCKGKRISSYALHNEKLATASLEKGETRIDMFDLTNQQNLSSFMIGVKSLHALTFDEND